MFWSRINTNYIRMDTNNRGQALVELAVFGTLLIFCLSLLLRYGMSANYSQNIQMQTFRKAFVRAGQYDPNAPYNRGQYNSANANWDYENANPPVPSNYWRSVNYTVIEDKPVLSASGILPIGERSPVGASVEAVRSIDMFGEMEYGEEEALPRVEFEIDGRRYSFTTAEFKEYAQHDQMRKKEDIEDWDGQGPSRQWRRVSSANAGDSVDVDGDGHEEYVLAKSGNILQVIDYQEGEINLSEKIGDSGEEKGGLKEYNKDTQVGNSTFNRQEDSAGVTTTEDISAQEAFTRRIQTRDGDYYVTDTFPTQKTKSWYTPRK